jgi:hypothetical protein
MLDQTREEQVMKRTVVVLGIAAALFVAPSVANAASAPQVRSQVVESQVVESQLYRSQVVRQIVRPQLVKQQFRSQRASALSVSQLRALSR